MRVEVPMIPMLPMMMPMMMMMMIWSKHDIRHERRSDARAVRECGTRAHEKHPFSTERFASLNILFY